MLYKFAYLPAGLFNRAQVKLRESSVLKPVICLSGVMLKIFCLFHCQLYLQVRLFNFSDGKIIWKNGSFLKKNKHLALIKQEK